MSKLFRALGYGLIATAGLHAGEVVATEDREGNPITPLESIAPKPHPLGMKPLQPNVLATKRGGTEIASEMMLKGVVSDNRAINVATGSNSISEGALTNTAGLPMIIQNTGNNVLIQNATIVNVQLK